MNTSIATPTRYTPDDLLAMPDGKSYELVEGELVERKMGMESSWVATRLVSRLERFCDETQLGWVFQSDNGYQCFPHDSGLVRKPDLSFIRRGRLPGGIVPKGWSKIPPDLVAEVASPNETVYELSDKLEDYQSVDVHLIWVINPKSRTAIVYRADGTVSYLHEKDDLSGEDVIPGFRCPLVEIFPPREPLAQSPESLTGPNGPRKSG